MNQNQYYTFDFRIKISGMSFQIIHTDIKISLFYDILYLWEFHSSKNYIKYVYNIHKIE